MKPHHYTLKDTNRFRGLDLVDRVPEEQVHKLVQEVVTKIIPKGKKKGTRLHDHH